MEKQNLTTGFQNVDNSQHQFLMKFLEDVLKPGGRVVIFDFDWDAMVIAHGDKALTRKIVRYASDSFPNGRVGPELFHLMREAGFTNVRVQPSSYSGNDRVMQDITKRVHEGILQTGVSTGVLTQTEIADWWAAFDKDVSEGNLFVSYQGFIVSGTND
ncbi:MAG: hypothetical protein BGO55_07410 [Sphingobacteriales bacterium 50-39]|nr:hypothetical protein [Sphingobacteriales bacterium]OJW53072.1 MAG: hypothetical protein BGO55_07410 [Sphingobacteriales bacterium 50-39]